MYYQLYEMNHAAMQPMRAIADTMRLFYSNPLNPLTHTPFGRSMAAGAELFERTTRRYGKPAFGLEETKVDFKPVPVVERVIWSKPFCDLIHFDRAVDPQRRPDPKILMIAPMSGHYATLLRGTVETFLPTHEVYITDWTDAREVPLIEGSFDLDDYIDYVIHMCHLLGPDVHLMAVCQPAVPVLAAVALMEARGDPSTPRSMTLMGGPIDTRRSPTSVNLVAQERGTEWFRSHCIVKVPPPNPGFWRDVYPGFFQLSGFMAMNLDRHISAHWDMFNHLVDEDGDSAEKHREFYDEYLAVMDLTAEFYMQTVETVFVEHSLPRGTMMHRGERVDLTAIRHCAIMAVEGERDDISGIGQTLAALELATNLPEEKKLYHMQKRVGHYGVFNGSRFRSEIAPAIAGFMATADAMAEAGSGAQQKRGAHLRSVG